MGRILILEDDVNLGPLLKVSLEDEGHSVSLQSTATAALAYASENDVDLVIADILIKVGGALVQDGGIKLISRLKQIEARRMPVIAISGAFGNERGGQEITSTAFTVGADATLAKPFAPDDLIVLVNRLLMER